jgi:Transglutaminase-like superfamily
MQKLAMFLRRCRTALATGARSRSGTAAPAVRLRLENLEERCLPSTAAALPPGVAVTFSRLQDGSPHRIAAAWAANNNHAFIDAQPQALLQNMDFNTAATYRIYTQYFHGVLRGWVAQADQQGITSDAGLTQFLAGRLQAQFQKTRGVLVRMYPSHNDQTYRLLMAMNLVHGFYTYATVPPIQRSLYAKLHLRAGDCAEIAQLLQAVVQAEGIPARQLVQSYNYPSALGPFIASHDVVYAGGLWLDAEINTAFRLDLARFEGIAPAQRLNSLFDSNRVFGFYNWYLQPAVRQAQLSHGLDGGIIAFYYQYYFAGIGQGHTQLTFWS